MVKTQTRGCIHYETAQCTLGIHEDCNIRVDCAIISYSTIVWQQKTLTNGGMHKIFDEQNSDELIAGFIKETVRGNG